MVLLHIVLVPLIILSVLWLLRQKHYLDAAVFGVVSTVGYGLWVGIANHRPLIITTFIENMINRIW